MNEQRIRVEKQPVENRIRNFDEVCLGYTEQQAVEEAKRCLSCVKRPCVAGCPVSNNIPEFIKFVANGEFEKAYDIIRQNNCMPAVTGRVCQQERQCEQKCTRGIKGEPIAIGLLERFVADYHANHVVDVKNELPLFANGIKENAKKVAVVGSGPAGIACADRLADLGYNVTVFEKMSKSGGILTYGIPEFCLPTLIVQREIDDIKNKGVDVVTDTVIGENVKIADLLSGGCDAVFLGNGANKAYNLNVDGEDLDGVISANDYLYTANTTDYETLLSSELRAKNVIVIGGGNVAIDAARCALRLSESVTVAYRRTEGELPARKEEILNAKEEGVQFEYLVAPVKFHGKNGKVTAVEFVKMQLGELDASGRATPVKIIGSNFLQQTDLVIVAIGAGADGVITSSDERIKTSGKGLITIGEDTMSTMDGVFAGGDNVTGPSTVITCAKAGKKSADEIDKYIKNKYGV